MFKKRALPALILMTSLGTAALAATFAPQEAQAEGELDCSKIKNDKVKAKCTAGENTVTKMKKVMDKWTDDAQDASKAKGQDGKFKDGETKIKCGACHEDGTKAGPLTPGAKGFWDEFVVLANIK